MANDLYVRLKTNTAKNVCDEIRKMLSAQKAEKASIKICKEAACETTEYSKEVQAKFDGISQIAKIIADQRPQSFVPDSFYMNVMHVQFSSMKSIETVKRQFKEIAVLVAVSDEKFERVNPEVHRKTAQEEPKEPCLGKKKCTGICARCPNA